MMSGELRRTSGVPRMLIPFLFLLLGTSCEPRAEPEESPTYVVQTGQVSGGQDQITLIINSTNDAGDGPAMVQDDDSIRNHTAESTDGPKGNRKEDSTSTLEKTSDFVRKQRNWGPKPCRRYSDQEKYSMLEHMGALNQQRMANSPEEAGRNFASSFLKDVPQGVLSDSPDFASSPDVMCDATCQLITHVIRDSLLQLNSSSSGAAADSPTMSDGSGPEEVQEGRSKPDSPEGRSCALQHFTSVGCENAGNEQNWGYQGLCSSCRGVYMLSNNCFPSLLNAVNCQGVNVGCVFDPRTKSAHGRCESQSTSVIVLRNNGQGGCEDWQRVYLTVPTSCNCLLSSSSYLSPVPFTFG